MTNADLEAMKRNPNRYDKDHAGISDMQCPKCREPFVITGDTPEAKARAIAEWSGCCIPNPSAAEEARAPAAEDQPFPLAAALIVAGLAVWFCAVIGGLLGLVMSAVT